MYTKPTLERFGTFRDLTQLGCTGASDAMIPGIGVANGNVPEVYIGPDGRKTLKVCFSAVSSGM